MGNNNIKLNIGCGTDYREGYINIDGSTSLIKVDKVIDISTQSLEDFFDENSVEHIIANDIIEHHFHWEAVRILNECYQLLSKTGSIEIRVPDCEYIISSNSFSIERKLTLLFGGQDIPQGVDVEMDKSRREFPQYFCHKYGWTMDRLKNDLLKIGFKSIEMVRADTNFVTYAYKTKKSFLGKLLS